MKTLRIEGLALEIDYYGRDALEEARRVIASVNDVLSNLGGDPALFLPDPLVAIVRDDPDDEEEAPDATRTDPG